MAMRHAYLGIKYHADNRNRTDIEGLSSTLEACGYATWNVARDVERWGGVTLSSTELMRCTFDLIDRSDLVVIELSEKGVGLGIEAGYAYAKDIPVITVARAGADVSTTLRGISRAVFFYACPQELVPVFRDLKR
jgi:nucleoside 2-deoxyribosyltransferase